MEAGEPLSLFSTVTNSYDTPCPWSPDPKAPQIRFLKLRQYLPRQEFLSEILLATIANPRDTLPQSAWPNLLPPSLLGPIDRSKANDTQVRKVVLGCPGQSHKSEV